MCRRASEREDLRRARRHAHLRTLRLVDGPDEVHKRTLARTELRAHEHAATAA